jgi:hypothetical protein
VLGKIAAMFVFTGLATSPLASFEGSRYLAADYFGGFLSTIFNYDYSQLKMKKIIIIE